MVATIDVYVPSMGSTMAVPFKPDEKAVLFKNRLASKMATDPNRIKLAVNGIRVIGDHDVDYYRVYGGPWVAQLRGNPSSSTAGCLFVETLTGKTLIIQLDWVDTVADLKDAVWEQLSNCPADQQRIIFAGRQLEDDKTLSHYGISNESFVRLVLRLRGGASGFGFKFADVSSPDGTSRVPLAETAPPGRCIDEGINIEVKCRCTSYMVISPQKLGRLDLVMDRNKIKCPNCENADVTLDTVGFYNCEYRTHGLKIVNGNPIQHTSPWKAVPVTDAYQRFDPVKTGTATWIRLVFEAKSLNSPGDCVICLEPLTQDVKVQPRCGHVFHGACITEWTRRNPVCPSCRQNV